MQEPVPPRRTRRDRTKPFANESRQKEHDNFMARLDEMQKMISQVPPPKEITIYTSPEGMKMWDRIWEEEWKEYVEKDPYHHAGFVVPKGRGILDQIEGGDKTHKFPEWFEALRPKLPADCTPPTPIYHFDENGVLILDGYVEPKRIGQVQIHGTGNTGEDGESPWMPFEQYMEKQEYMMWFGGKPGMWKDPPAQAPTRYDKSKFQMPEDLTK